MYNQTIKMPARSGMSVLVAMQSLKQILAPVKVRKVIKTRK